MKLVFFRRFRGAWFRWEWHDHNGVTFLSIAWAHPRKHAWWALLTYIYLRGA